jgi:hypothetical protein
MYKELQVSKDIPESRLKRAFKNGTLTLTSAELKGSGATLHLHPESYAKALKARKANKGTRLTITKKEIGYPFKHMQGGGTYGGSIWGKIWGGIKKAFKWAKDSGVLSKVADAAVAPLAAYTGNPQAVMAARSGLKTLTGVGVDYSSDEEKGGRISLAEVKKRGKQALKYMKDKGIITDIVNKGEDYLLSKAENDSQRELIKYTRKGIKNKFGVGMAIKGTSQAKERMSLVRAAKTKKKAGGSFML